MYTRWAASIPNLLGILHTQLVVLLDVNCISKGGKSILHQLIFFSCTWMSIDPVFHVYFEYINIYVCTDKFYAGLFGSDCVN